MLNVTIEIDVSGLEKSVEKGKRELRDDLRKVQRAAAEAGVEEEQEHHPYTDRTWQLTERAHVEENAEGEAEMVWPKDYASFVDGRGYDPTAQASGRYAFTPIAEQRARAAAERGAEKAVERLRDTLEKA